VEQRWTEELPRDVEPESEDRGSLRGRLPDGSPVVARVVVTESEQEGRELVAHLRAMPDLADPRLVPMVGAAVRPRAVWLLFEGGGVSLQALLDRGGLPAPLAVAAGLETLAALAALHAGGLAHGDLHASSVRILPDGRVRLGDHALPPRFISGADPVGDASGDLVAAGALLCAALGVPARPGGGELLDAERAAPAFVATGRALAAGRGARSAAAALAALRAAAGSMAAPASAARHLRLLGALAAGPDGVPPPEAAPEPPPAPMPVRPAPTGPSDRRASSAAWAAALPAGLAALRARIASAGAPASAARQLRRLGGLVAGPDGVSAPPAPPESSPPPMPARPAPAVRAASTGPSDRRASSAAWVAALPAGLAAMRARIASAGVPASVARQLRRLGELAAGPGAAARPPAWTALLVLGLAGVAAAGIVLGVAAAHAGAPARSARVPAGTAVTARQPAPTAAPAGPVPAATPDPAATPTPAPPAPAPPAPAPVDQVAAGSPDAAVSRFYQLVAQHRFDAAVQLWTARMQAAYPPGENVYQRFADTTSMTLVSDQVTAPAGSSALVSVTVVEVRSGQTTRWVGTWYVVRGSSGWLLDQPALRPA
jgi:hypothetical protein